MTLAAWRPGGLEHTYAGKTGNIVAAWLAVCPMVWRSDDE